MLQLDENGVKVESCELRLLQPLQHASSMVGAALVSQPTPPCNVQSIATHTKLWYEIDARGQVVGRLAVQLVRLLQGKTKPIYHPSSQWWHGAVLDATTV